MLLGQTELGINASLTIPLLMVKGQVLDIIKEKRDYSKNPKFGYVVEFAEVLNQDDATVLICEHLYLVERKA